MLRLLETGALDDLDGTGSTEGLAGAAIDVAVDFLDDVCKGLEAKGSSSSSLKSMSMTSGSLTIGPFFEAGALLIEVTSILGGVGVGGFMDILPLPGLSLLLAAFEVVLLGVELLPLLGVLLFVPREIVLFGEFLTAFVRALVKRDFAEALLGWLEPDPESNEEHQFRSRTSLLIFVSVGVL